MDFFCLCVTYRVYLTFPSYFLLTHLLRGINKSWYLWIKKWTSHHHSCRKWQLFHNNCAGFGLLDYDLLFNKVCFLCCQDPSAFCLHANRPCKLFIIWLNSALRFLQSWSTLQAHLMSLHRAKWRGICWCRLRSWPARLSTSPQTGLMRPDACGMSRKKSLQEHPRSSSAADSKSDIKLKHGRRRKRGAEKQREERQQRPFFILSVGCRWGCELGTCGVHLPVRADQNLARWGW